ncbi:hypothetical protein Dimus_036861 [Dionaea muscipula]
MGDAAAGYVCRRPPSPPPTHDRRRRILLSFTQHRVDPSPVSEIGDSAEKLRFEVGASHRRSGFRSQRRWGIILTPEDYSSRVTRLVVLQQAPWRLSTRDPILVVRHCRHRASARWSVSGCSTGVVDVPQQIGHAVVAKGDGPVLVVGGDVQRGRVVVGKNRGPSRGRTAPPGRDEHVVGGPGER